jgi:hypothetical protein
MLERAITFFGHFEGRRNHNRTPMDTARQSRNQSRTERLACPGAGEKGSGHESRILKPVLQKRTKETEAHGSRNSCRARNQQDSASSLPTDSFGGPMERQRRTPSQPGPTAQDDPSTSTAGLKARFKTLDGSTHQDGAGFQPLTMWLDKDLGRWPGLAW